MVSKIGNQATISRMECQLMRDFSGAVDILLEQFERFQRSKTLSHPALSDLIGVFENRGALWRLKDTGHLLFSRPENPAGQLLDRTLGAIYHESVKLMEATYQSQHYANACKTFIRSSLAESLELAGAQQPGEPNGKTERQSLEEAAARLLEVLQECAEDLEAGINRLTELLEIARPLLCICFAGRKSNSMLVRYLDERRELAARAMASHYQNFLQALDWENQTWPENVPWLACFNEVRED